ncbi:MAG: Threonine-tRNA ligase [candidate division TM6 bacterium GW2011_GWF2_30_66]|nr:MAG: Threonine-tRNA ligase [candidate division TM6 bacterium GW2011_GWF2_30_66]
MAKNKHEKYTLEQLRHSAAHLAAQAILELYPNTNLTLGPATANGFFYDFQPTENLKEEDIEKITEKMHEIVARDIPIIQKEISKDEAIKLYKNNPFKLELIAGIPEDTVGLACQGDFYDLCKGGHVESTKALKHFKLTGLSGSYWRADKKNQQLQRISGIVFASQQDLEKYEKLLEEAKLYDHRKLGKELDLFSFHEEGVGFPFFHPRGKKIINILTNFLRKRLEAENYQEISTPIILSEELWKQSGHYAHYKDNMYYCKIDDKENAVKPMNCPGAILVYKSKPHSFRDLPLRMSEFGLVHRHELSGVLHGLMRVRAFTQDDAHIFCTPEQMEHEIVELIKLIFSTLSKFGFAKIKIYLSTRPKNSIGSDELWERATNALKLALEKQGLEYEINEGDGAFYGPKIDFIIQDSMEREWQCSTIQADFFLPENFDLTYIASGGEKKRPVMLHRVIYGSFERFFAILIEHYKGKFPFWLAPVQARILTITDDQKCYACDLAQKLKDHGIRVEVDQSGDQINSQIKAAQLDKIPWMLVVGKKEVENNTITLRYLNGKQEFGLTLDNLLEKANKELEVIN